MATTNNINFASTNSNVDISKNNKNLTNDNKLKNLVQENSKLNEYVAEQEEALFNEIQKNAKLEKVNNELYEQVNFYKMEVVDLNQKISYITNKIKCDDIVKDLIYRQQAEIVSLKEELSMSKSTSNQLRSRLKSQVEELKFIKRQSLQITSDMAKEVESQLADIQHQLYEANQTIEKQKSIIDSSKKAQTDYANIKSDLVKLQNKFDEEFQNTESNSEKLKLGVKALISIINDLEKENEDAILFFNEAGEEIRSLKGQIETERNDYNIMANEMGQEIIDLNQKVKIYEQEIGNLNEKIETTSKTVKSIMVAHCKGTLSQLNDSIESIQSDLRNFQSDANIDKYSVVEQVEIKLNKITNILKQHQGMIEDGTISERSTEIIGCAVNESSDPTPFKEKLGEMKKMYTDSIITINEMGNELMESKVQNESNNKKINDLSDLIIKLMETIVELESDKTHLQKNIDEYLDVINDCGEDIRKLHFNERDLINAISESGHEICVLKQKIQEMISYQEKYMSMDGEVLMNKVASLTSRNQELEKELTLLRKFDINNSLKKSLEEGQLQSAWYEISKLRSHVEKLTQNSRQLEKDLANARKEISSIILTRDEAIITQQEAVENFEALQRSYIQQMHHLRNEVFRIYSSRPSEANNRVLNFVNEMQMLPNYSNIQYENRMRNARYEAIESKLHEAEDVIDSLTRENFEYQRTLNKLNDINEKLVAKLIVQNKNSQEGSINLSQSSVESVPPYTVPKRSRDRQPSNSIHNNKSPVYISPSSTPIPPPHGSSTPIPPPHAISYSAPSTTTTSLYTTVQTSVSSPIVSKQPYNHNHNHNININTNKANTINNPPSPATIRSTNLEFPLPPPPPAMSALKKTQPPHLLKVKQSIENLNKRGVGRSTSQLYQQSDIRSPDTASPPLSPKFVSNIPNRADNFKIKESKEEYNKLLNYFGSIPHNNRVSDIKDEYHEMKDYMSFEIQNQNQIMEAIKNGEIPFYSSDNEDSTEVLVINEDE